MIVSLIAAMAKNQVIGSGNAIPWHLPADFAHFKQITMRHPVVMGERTFESIGKPLSGRVNIVLTEKGEIPGCVVAHSLNEAFREAEKTDTECFVIGGGSVYAQTLALADRLYLTEIDVEVVGDTYFPEFDKSEWIERSREHYRADEKNIYPMDFVVYERTMDLG